CQTTHLFDAVLKSAVTLDEEEISDVSLGTFYVSDNEATGTSQSGRGAQLAAGCGGCGCRGCAVRGCRGCGCGGFWWGGCEGCGCSCCWTWAPAETARLPRFPIP